MDVMCVTCCAMFLLTNLLDFFYSDKAGYINDFKIILNRSIEILFDKGCTNTDLFTEFE